MSDDKRLDELEKTVSQLVRDGEARKKEKKVSVRNRKLWLMISLVLVVSAVIISFTVSCDMSSLFDDIPPFDNDNPVIINPSEEEKPDNSYDIAKGEGVTILGFAPEYAVVSDTGELTIYGENSMFAVPGESVQLPDGTVIDFQVTTLAVQVIVDGEIVMIFRK